MSMNRYAKRRDANHRSIRDVLVAMGCDVLESDIVDLIVGLAGNTYLIEVKRDGRARLRPVQKRLRESWRGHYAIVTTPEEACKAVGLL